ncbi:MAG: hypothetical protein CFE34_07725 [Rhodobacteraceae bacterium PARR1]|nr:MAG: hypothetical protein CFE34_07725 [Rhodobacteraceae bacterium PARR1]
MFRTTLLAATLFAGAAFAQTPLAGGQATAFTDLNLRAGPGVGYPIVGVIPANTAVEVAGCLAAESWCRVALAGTEGWASGDYLTTVLEDTPVVIYPNRDRVTVETLTYEGDTAGNAAAGGTLGAITGLVLGGPVGAAVGGALGAATGAATTPEGSVTTYVLENPRDQVYLDGEVVVGATLPEVVPLNPVPDSGYSYAYVNGVPVLVDPAGRQVVQIVR